MDVVAGGRRDEGKISWQFLRTLRSSRRSGIILEELKLKCFSFDIHSHAMFPFKLFSLSAFAKKRYKINFSALSAGCLHKNA